MLLSTVIFCVMIIPYCYALGNNDFIAIKNCTCEGYDQVYECRVTGGGATVWRGTAFDCPSSSNEIILFHHGSSIQRSSVCNNGAIVGRVTRVENNTYVSQLTVSVSTEMVGMSISCFHDGEDINSIGSSSLTLTRDPLPPPSDLHLTDVNSTHLIFHWNPVSSSCEAIHYRITAPNCGHCPDVTNSTTVTCYGPFSNSDQLCTFAVRTVVCDNIVGNESRQIQVALRTPNAPVVNVIPTYSHKSKGLIALTTRFDELEPFNISDEIDSSVTSYTVTYTDFSTGIPCTSITVSAASSCKNKTCEHKLKLQLPSSPCSDSVGISVTVSAANRLGNGPSSVPVLASGVTNQFVDLSFNPASKIATCLFLNQPIAATEKTCHIVYGVQGKTSCKMFLHQSSKSLSNKVYIGFPETNHLQSQRKYCFIATASNKTFTVIVEGSMLTPTGTTASISRFTIGIVPFGASMGAMALLIIIIMAIFISITVILVRSRRALRTDLERLNTKTTEQPPVYEELDCVVPVSKPATSPTIDTGQNTAYLSLSGLFSNAILS